MTPRARNFCGIAIGAFVLFIQAAAASDYHSPRTAALGGAGHAGPILNDALYLNPSFASFLPTYSLSGSYYNFRGPSVEPEGLSPFHGHGFNASVQDGRSEVFQAGVGFTQFDHGRAVHVGASKTAVQRLGFGLGGKFLFMNDASVPLIRDGVFSTTVIPLDWLYVVGVIDNIFETEAGRSHGFHREFILGTKINIMGILLLYLDPHIAPGLTDQPKFGHETGLEITLMSDLFLRMGMFRSSKVPFADVRGNGYGAGIGWVAPRSSFDYAVSRVLTPAPSTSHSIGMTLYY